MSIAAGKMSLSWEKLSLREKLIIMGGVFVVAAAALVMLFSGLWQQHRILLAERQAAVEEYGWLYEQAGIAARLNNSCQDKQILKLAPEELLNLLASRNRLTLNGIENSAASYRLTFSSPDGNHVLAFVHQSACQGFELAGLTLATSDNSFNVEVELRHDS